MSSYIHFTDAQKELANRTDLYEFLNRRGEKLKRSGSEWEWKYGDAKITIRGNEWYHHYDRVGGGAVDFVKRFFDADYPQAVQMLLGENCGTVLQPENIQKEKKTFVIPPAHTDMRRLYAYLLKQRYIDRDIIYYFTHNKLLYEDAEYHNAVFVGCDENGIPRHAHKRGTVFDSGYKGNVDGSLPEYSFHHIGTSDRLYVFEAPVDLLSFLSIYPEDWQHHSYVALCCTAEHAAIYQLKKNPNLKTVLLCLDHDKAGIEGCYRLAERIRELGPEYAIKMIRPEYKDWNESLKEKNGVEPIIGTEHPAMEYIRELCMSLPDECGDEHCPRNPFDTLTEQYEKLKRASKNNTEAIREQTLEMAKAALLFCPFRHKQLGVYMPDGWYMERMFEQYRPHRDNGGYKSHLGDIGYHLQSVIRDFSEDRIYTKSELENQIVRTLEVGLDCLRLNAYSALSQEQAPTNYMTMQ
ncbi:MAG: DUF3991 and toprim domain-containing protein [Eubacteriales bacterium]|nr:DUF3991 and toprim domain-containing protein [Eubacteriales bacterium]